ncbi:MAG TPA: hypothetical protein VMN81_06235 [Vicinamibacterales bacterium]|nr:hypothetical protein [Vicinamibacterales bacterium]
MFQRDGVKRTSERPLFGATRPDGALEYCTPPSTIGDRGARDADSKTALGWPDRESLLQGFEQERGRHGLDEQPLKVRLLDSPVSGGRLR